MDYWNLKAPIWDFTEFPDQETVDSSTSTTASAMMPPQGDFSVDLKLGQVSSGSSVVYEAGEGSKKGGSLVVVAGPTKRARGAVNNNNNNNVNVVASVSCLVDGCYMDLNNNCREYHRRHKVCELHSKTPEVTIGGHKQRFCQQCSRFHSLEEFDEGKRSCRKRLEGHNRRRRKPQPDPPLMQQPLVINCLSNNYQGTRSSPFPNTNHIYSSAVGNPIWAGVNNNPEAEAAAAAAHYNQQMHCFHNILPSGHHGSSSPSTMFGGGGGATKSSFSLLHGNQMLPSRAISLPDTGGHHNNNRNNTNLYCEGLSLQVHHHDTDHCALSLLSPPTHMNMMQTPTTTGLNPATFEDEHSPQTLPFHWD